MPTVPRGRPPCPCNLCACPPPSPASAAESGFASFLRTFPGHYSWSAPASMDHAVPRMRPAIASCSTIGVYWPARLVPTLAPRPYPVGVCLTLVDTIPRCASSAASRRFAHHPWCLLACPLGTYLGTQALPSRCPPYSGYPRPSSAPPKRDVFYRPLVCSVGAPLGA